MLGRRILFRAAALVSLWPALIGVRAEDRSPTYDYIIVGGGVSGLVVANRLTEGGKSESVPMLTIPPY